MHKQITNHPSYLTKHFRASEGTLARAKPDHSVPRVYNYHVVHQVLEQAARGEDQQASDMCNLLWLVRSSNIIVKLLMSCDYHKDPNNLETPLGKKPTDMSSGCSSPTLLS